MIFQPEHAGDITSVYLLNEIFESISDLFAKEILIQKGYDPYLYDCLCVYLPVLLIKILHIAVFLLIKLRIKNLHHTVLDVLLETYLLIFWLLSQNLSC